MAPDRPTVEERVIDDRKALGARDRVAKSPTQRAAKASDSKQPETPLDRVQRIWTATVKKKNRRVVIGDLDVFVDAKKGQKPAIGELAGRGYVAWTNSAKLVLVDLTIAASLDAISLGIYLKHEACHVDRFRSRTTRESFAAPPSSASGPPRTFQEMVLLELEAYELTKADFIRAGRDADVAGVDRTLADLNSVRTLGGTDDQATFTAMTTNSLLLPESLATVIPAPASPAALYVP